MNTTDLKQELKQLTYSKNYTFLYSTTFNGGDGERALYTFLLSDTNDGVGYSCFSKEQLSIIMNTSKRTIQRYIESLKKQGFIRTEIKTNKAKVTHSEIYIIADKLMQCIDDYKSSKVYEIMTNRLSKKPTTAPTQQVNESKQISESVQKPENTTSDKPTLIQEMNRVCIDTLKKIVAINKESPSAINNALTTKLGYLIDKNLTPTQLTSLKNTYDSITKSFLASLEEPNATTPRLANKIYNTHDFDSVIEDVMYAKPSVAHIVSVDAWQKIQEEEEQNQPITTKQVTIQSNSFNIDDDDSDEIPF